MVIGKISTLIVLALLSYAATVGEMALAQGQPALFSPETRRVGNVASVVPAAFGTQVRRERRVMDVDDPVFGEELIETGDDGGISIELLDGTELYIGAGSRLALQRFVYEAASQRMTQVFSFVSGSFRVVSGKFAKSSFRFETPVATIGIRGTDFEVVVNRFGSTKVSVHEGSVVVRPLSGEARVIGPDVQATVLPDGAGVSVARATFSDDPILLLGGRSAESPNDRDRAVRTPSNPRPARALPTPAPRQTLPTQRDSGTVEATDAVEAQLFQERRRLERDEERARATVDLEARKASTVLDRASRRLEEIRNNARRN